MNWQLIPSPRWWTHNATCRLAHLIGTNQRLVRPKPQKRSQPELVQKAFLVCPKSGEKKNGVLRRQSSLFAVFSFLKPRCHLGKFPFFGMPSLSPRLGPLPARRATEGPAQLSLPENPSKAKRRSPSYPPANSHGI